MDTMSRICELEATIDELRLKLSNNESEFSQKRALFKDLFVAKENELKETRSELMVVKEEMSYLNRELEDVRSAAAILESGPHDEVKMVQDKYQEEVASLQHIMKQRIEDEVSDHKEELDRARASWEEERRGLQSQLDECRRELSSQKENILSTVAKALRRVAPDMNLVGVSADTEQSPTTARSASNADTMEAAMRQAQKDVDALKMVVLPYEDEIRSLKTKIREAYARVDELEAQQKEQAIQGDDTTLRKEILELRHQVDVERKQAEAVRANWQRANDQFLDSQHARMAELRHVESLLSDEQKARLRDLIQDGQTPMLDSADSPMPQRRIRRMLGLQNADSLGSLNDSSVVESSRVKKAWSGGQLNHLPHEEGGSIAAGSQRKQSGETQSLFDFEVKTDEDDFFSTSKHPGRSRCYANASSSGESGAVPASPTSLVGKRVVSEKEWTRLQLELRAAKRRVIGTCQMCSNYEDQLQTLQGNFQEKDKKLRIVQSQLEAAEKDTASLRDYQDELENKLKTTATAQRDKIEDIASRLTAAHSQVTDLSEALVSYRRKAEHQISGLIEEREKAAKAIDKLERDYESLLGRRSTKARELAAELIDLPGDREELERLALRLREDLIEAKAAREQIEENLKAEGAFLREQIQAEQSERKGLEESLNSEIADLQEQVATLASVRSEYDRERRVRENAESEAAEASGQLAQEEAKVARNHAERGRLENEVRELRQRVQALQIELENSESVQKDFVKLSQTLQIQLEQLRQEEHEVRWVHDEDVSDCLNCRASFGLGRKKHHCRHCGKVFCADCLDKVVLCGPSQRPARVCRVCHTMLVKDAVPYFSKDQPKTAS